MAKLVFLFFILLSTLICSAQNSHDIDSMLAVLKTAKNDSAKVNLLRYIGAFYAYQDPRKAIDYWKKGVDLSYRLKYIKGLARNYINVGTGYALISKFDSTVLFADSAIKYCKIIGDPDRLALVYLNKSDAYRNLGNFELALIFSDTALQYAAKTGNTDRLARIYDNISSIYSEQEQFTASLQKKRMALDLYKKDSNFILEAQVYDDFSTIYSLMGNLDSALYYSKKAVTLGEEIEDITNLPTYYFGVAELNLKQKKYTEAEKQANKALQYAIKLGSDNHLGLVYNLLGNIYFYQGRLAEAAKAGETAYKYSLGDVATMQQEISSSLAKTYNALDDFKNAYKYLSISNILLDSITKEKYNTQVAKLQSTFEFKEKDKEIQLLGKDKILQQQKISRQRLLFAGAAALLLLALIGTGLIINRNKLKQRMKELELRNRIAADLHDEVGSTLSSISMLSQMAIHQTDIVKQKDILEKMTSNAKESMDKMGDIVWMIKPGETESGSLKQRIERFAFEVCESKNIALQMQLDELDKLKLSMGQRKNIYLVFKEAVNNAAKYSGTEKIEIEVKLINKELLISIKDFGKGFAGNLVKNGNGLQNMQSRAKEMQGKLSVESNINTGTTITLLVPVL